MERTSVRLAALQRTVGTLSRSCAYPRCDERLTITLTEPGTRFRGAVYCPGHQVLANRRRRRLVTALDEIEGLLRDPSKATAILGSGHTRASLTKWCMRIQWELDSIPTERPASTSRARRAVEQPAVLTDI